MFGSFPFLFEIFETDMAYGETKLVTESERHESPWMQLHFVTGCSPVGTFSGRREKNDLKLCGYV
jgi:hypothetical protein